MPDKKNQHFIPQFFLKNFSLNENRKTVGAYLVKSLEYVKSAPIKNQCSKPYFYGKSGIVEGFFSNFETHSAPLFSKIIKEKNGIKLSIEESALIFLFISLLELRNPIFFHHYKSHNLLINEAINKELEGEKVYLDLPQVTHEETIEMMLKLADLTFEGLIDLEIKFLINKSKTPFLCSDFPLVKYNKFLNNRKYELTKTANGIVGIQIFLPISPCITIAFYDKKIYKLGNKRDVYVNLNNEKDIFELNLLQYLNSINAIYFNEGITENYLKILGDRSQKYIKPNLLYVKPGKLKSVGNGTHNKNDLFIFTKSETDFIAAFNYFNLTKYSSSHILDESVTQLRKYIKQYMSEKFLKEGIKSWNMEKFYKEK